MRQTRNNIPEESRRHIVKELNGVLAELIDLSLQLKQAHWNVRGSTFQQIHELLDSIHEDVDGYVDSVAERITSLGGRADGTVETVRSGSKLPVYPVSVTDIPGSLKAIADSIAAVDKPITHGLLERCDELGDAVTVDLLTTLSAMLQKSLWFVESNLG